MRSILASAGMVASRGSVPIIRPKYASRASGEKRSGTSLQRSSSSISESETPSRNASKSFWVLDLLFGRYLTISVFIFWSPFLVYLAFSTGKNWGTLIASVRSPETLSLPVIKGLVESSLPSAMSIQTLLLVVKVTSGFSTPPGIKVPLPLAIWNAQIPGSSPVIFHWSVLFRPSAATELNLPGIDSKSSALVIVASPSRYAFQKNSQDYAKNTVILLQELTAPLFLCTDWPGAPEP